MHLFEVIAEVAPGAEGRVADGAHVVTDPTTQITNKVNKLGLKPKFSSPFRENPIHVSAKVARETDPTSQH